MIYYIMKGQIFTIFLSMTHLTLINFPNRVNEYVGGQKGDFKVYELNKGRGLVYEPLKKGFSRNFISFLSHDKYYYNLTYNETFANKDITIARGEKCSTFTLLKDNSRYQLFECPRSLYFINKQKNPVKLNDMTIIDSSYLSKGPPIYLDKKLIYYRGEVL